jgi:hypothetical protein
LTGLAYRKVGGLAWAAGIQQAGGPAGAALDEVEKVLREQLTAIRRLDRQLGAVIAYDEVCVKTRQIGSLLTTAGACHPELSQPSPAQLARPTGETLSSERVNHRPKSACVASAVPAESTLPCG